MQSLTYRDPREFCQTIDGKHLYTVPGFDEALPSVSELLRCSDIEDMSGLEKWKRDVGEQTAALISARATYRGSQVHAMIESCLLTKAADVETPEILSDDDIEKATKEAIAIYSASQGVLNRVYDVELIESVVWHDVLAYAGTLDCLAAFDDELSVIDWKTSGKQARIKSSFPYQLCAYATALNKLEGRVVVSKGVSVVMTPRGATVKKFDLERYWPWWIECCKKYYAARDPDRFDQICEAYDLISKAA